MKSIIEGDEKFDHSLYVVRFTDFMEFYATKEELNLKIMRLLENLDVDMAFPSRTIYLH